MSPYLVELGQSFMLSLLANGVVPKERLWGERNMLEWPLRMALQWPDAEVPKLMYLSGLAKAASYQSTILHELESRTLELIKDARRTNSPAARLAPIVWRIFGMTEELTQHREALGPDAKDEYRQWLLRVSAGSSDSSQGSESEEQA